MNEFLDVVHGDGVTHQVEDPQVEELYEIGPPVDGETPAKSGKFLQKYSATYSFLLNFCLFCIHTRHKT